MAEYDGVLKPRNFEIFRDKLEENGMGQLGRQLFICFRQVAGTVL